MGKTAFSGPVYGAKSLLWQACAFSSGGTTRVASVTVLPPYQDWYVTEVTASFSTGSSAGNAFILKTEGGSTTIPRYQGQASTVAQTLTTLNSGTSTSLNTIATLTPTAGEYEGVYVPAGSTVRLVSSGVNPVSQPNVSVYGYIRFIPSTRAEA